MTFTPQHRQTLQVILDGRYTPLDVREFVQFCYLLALPLVRSKIHRGKLNLDLLGLHEIDIVYDCLADLFRRDTAGDFVQVKSFFENQKLDPRSAHEDDLLLAMRRLVFGRVHCSIIRLYSEADSALGKILRNLSLELDRSALFEHKARFGETYLIVRDIDPCLHRAPMPSEHLRQQFSQIVSVRDSVPAMLEKLHRLLVAGEEYQRAVPLVTAGLLFKEAYALGAEVQEAETVEAERQLEREDVGRIVEVVCRSIAAEARPSYVGKGKRSEEVFGKYMTALKEILLGEYGGAENNGDSYYDHLKLHLPGLTKAIYSRRHRTVMEYLAKRAKRRMAEELKKI